MARLSKQHKLAQQPKVELPEPPPPLPEGATPFERRLGVERGNAWRLADAALVAGEAKSANYYRGRSNALDDVLRWIGEASTQ